MSARILWQRMPIQVPMPKWSKVCIHCLLTFILSRCNFLFCCRCHASSGKCDCKPGWTGIFCDTPCPAGRYGQDCQEKCDCKNGATCSHIKGEIPYLFGLPKGFPMNPCCFLLKLPWNMGQFEIFSSLVTTLRFPVFNPCEEVKDMRQFCPDDFPRDNAVFYCIWKQSYLDWKPKAEKVSIEILSVFDVLDLLEHFARTDSIHSKTNHNKINHLII